MAADHKPPARCPQCGSAFAPSTPGKRYCSRSCKENARKCRRDKELRAARPAPLCDVCGAPKPSYKHRYCATCAATSRSGGTYVHE